LHIHLVAEHSYYDLSRWWSCEVHHLQLPHFQTEL